MYSILQKSNKQLQGIYDGTFMFSEYRAEVFKIVDPPTYLHFGILKDKSGQSGEVWKLDFQILGEMQMHCHISCHNKLEVAAGQK